ncbi:MAG: hypothetical protein J0M04_14340 [Verrucomicrobia bacterium]|nr:hypothetical protein [Verrucomicrobiota bacterium]
MAFRQTLERLDSINSQLRTLAVIILRADERPGLIGRCRYPSESQSLREEQATIGQPVALRIRRSQLDDELRQVNAVIGEHLRAAIEAASAHAITAAGGAEAACVYPLALRIQADLTRHRAIPPTANASARHVFLGQAWMSIDAAMATLHEIRFAVTTNPLPYRP